MKYQVPGVSDQRPKWSGMFDSYGFTYMWELLETVAGVFAPDPKEQRGDSNNEGDEPLDVLRHHCCPWMQAHKRHQVDFGHSSVRDSSRRMKIREMSPTRAYRWPRCTVLLCLRAMSKTPSGNQ